MKIKVEPRNPGKGDTVSEGKRAAAREWSPRQSWGSKPGVAGSRRQSLLRSLVGLGPAPNPALCAFATDGAAWAGRALGLRCGMQEWEPHHY